MTGGWDIHTHLMPQGIVEMAHDGAWNMSVGDGTLNFRGFRMPLDKMAHPETLVERVATDGLDGAVASLPPPLFRVDIEGTQRRAYVEAMNAGILAAVSDHPRIRPMAYLPTDVPELAVAMARTLDERFVGVIVGTELPHSTYADSAYHPLWQVLSQRRFPMLIHPSESKDERLRPFYLSNLFGNPMETALAAAHLIFGDVPTRFPDLKVVLSHGGGATAALVGRWQRGVDTNRPGLKPLGLSPADAARWFHVDTIVHSPAILDLLEKTFGIDNMLLGSDWPFPMGASTAGHDIGHLEARPQGQIRSANALRLFPALREGAG